MVKVNSLKHVYPDKTEVSLCGLDFIVHKGERVVVLGSNGSGKTTLLAHIMGLLSPSEGHVEVMGLRPDKKFSIIRKKIGVVFQNVDEQIIGPRVYDDIAFTLRNDGFSKEEIDRRIEKVAKDLGITDILQKIPHYISSGQKKKVALAGAIIHKPEILVLDEPFESLDPGSKKDMVAIINRLNKEQGTTLIMTTHNINIVPSIADTIYIVHQGQIVTKGSPREVFKKAELMNSVNVESPLLVELFFRLKKQGFNLDIPLSVDEAEEIIVNNMCMK